MFLLIPFALFPVFWCVATLHDWLAGDARTMIGILHGSRGHLLHQALGDWRASMPFSMVAAWAIFLPVYLIAGRAMRGGSFHPVFAGAVTGVLIGLLLYRQEIAGILIMGVTGCLMGIGLLFVKAIFYK